MSSENSITKNQSTNRISSNEKFGQVHSIENPISNTKPNLLKTFMKSLNSLFAKNSGNESSKYLSLIG